MIYEYAIDPSFLLELTDKNDLCRELCRTLKLGSACITAGYPDNLGAKAYELIRQQYDAATDSRHKAKLQERTSRVIELAAELTQTTTQRYNVVLWGQGFSGEHARLPFQGILTTHASDSSEPHRNITWLRDPNCPLFVCTRSNIVQRSGQDMNHIMLPLLQNASNLTFVDPYFYPNRRFEDPYKRHFSSISAQNHIRACGLRTIIIVCAVDTGNTACSAADFKKSCEDCLPRWMSSRLSLQIHRIKNIYQGQEVHNRYILTDIGGISFGHGTDDSRNNSFDDISLLSAHQLAHWKAAYTPASAHFDWSEPPVIITCP